MPGVPEYYAFGREIGEDPLKALKAPKAPKAAAAPRPEPVISEPGPAPVAVVRPPRRRRRRGGVARLIVVCAALGAGLYAVGTVPVHVDGGIEDVVEGPSIEAPAAPATGITGDSLIRRANFADAMATLAGAGLGRPLTMRVAPDRIDATLIGNGRLHQVRVTPGGEITELATGAAAPGHTIAYKAIDASAPERLVKAGATKTVPAARIDYLVVTPGPPPTWAAYYKGGRIVIGDAHGHRQRVL
jgi:hypothetical protein